MLDHEELKRRRQERERERRKKSRKLWLRIGIAFAVLLVVVLGIFLFTRGSNPDISDEPTDPAQSGATVIHLAAAGDLNVTDRVVASGGEDFDYSNVFMDVGYLLGNADISVVNFEGNLVGSPYGSSYMSAPISLMKALDAAGVDLVQLANSYSIKNGMDGLSDTIDGIRSSGMEPVGAYASEAEYARSGGYTICNVQGVRIAFVAFTKGMDGMTLPVGRENCVNVLYSDYDSTYQKLNEQKINRILDSVAKEKPDLTVVLVHWGSEFNDSISASQVKLTELMFAKGVDAIIGTHPHYVQKMVYDPEAGTFIAYSLGDFISNGDRAGSEYSVILDLEITKSADGTTRITDYSYTPIFTVHDEANLRVVRIPEAMEAFEGRYINRVSQETYDAMQYALTRIEARVKAE